MEAVQDPQEIQVVNLPAEEPAPTPKKPDFKILQDKLSDLLADDTHPLETKAEVTPPAPTPAPAPPVAPQVQQAHPQQLLDAARNLGIDERHLAPGVVTTQALLDWVVSAKLKDSVIESLPRQQPQIPAAAPAEDEDEATLAYLADLQVDPKLVAFMRRQAAELKQLKGRPEPEKVVQQALAQRDAASAGEKAIDAAFGAMGQKFEKVFGKGSLVELEPGPTRSKRIRVFQAAGIDFAKDSAAVIRQKVTAAANDLYGDIIAEPAAPPPPSPAGAYGENGKEKPPVLMTKEEWAKASLGRPNGKAPSSREVAQREAIHDFYRDNKIPFDGGPAEDFEGVP